MEGASVTLRAYLRIFRERWRLVVLVVVLATGVAILITALMPKTYEASVQVFVTSNSSDTGNTSQYDPVAAAQNQVSTFASLIGSPDVAKAVKSDLNLSLTPNQIRDKLTADAPPAQTIVNIHATDRSPAVAANLANSAAKEFSSMIEKLKTPTDATKSTVHLTPTSHADSPSSPISPNATLNIAFGVILGLLVGAALAVARDVLDNRIKSVDELAKLTGRPAMGVVIEDPQAGRSPIASRAGPRNPRAENFRQLRANLQFADLDHHPRVIAITSSVPTEGKTMVAMNLASTLAEAGFTVCLVDADLRRPTVAKTLGLASPVGLTSVLIGQITLSEALQSAGTNFYVLSSGPTPPNPSEVLASSYVREVVRSLLDLVDYVVLDTAPLLPVADGSEVAALADGTLLVARHKLTTDAQVKRAMVSLTGVGATLMGVVLNGVSTKRGAGEYEYGYSYYRDAPRRGNPRSRGDSGSDRSRGEESTAGAHSQSDDDAAEQARIEEKA